MYKIYFSDLCHFARSWLVKFQFEISKPEHNLPWLAVASKLLWQCSHFQSCAFKSECENSTLALLQRFVGLVLSRAFSQSGNYFSCAVPGDDSSYVRFGETKDKYLNQSLRHGTGMRHRNMRSDSVLVHTGYIGTGAILVQGFGTQP